MIHLSNNVKDDVEMLQKKAYDLTQLNQNNIIMTFVTFQRHLLHCLINESYWLSSWSDITIIF